MANDKKNWLIIGIILVVVIAAVAVVFYQTPTTPQTKSYSLSDAERPKMTLSEKSFDLGTLKVDNKKIHEVTLKNIGQKPLAVANFSTSCDCTSVVVKQNEKASPSFSMHTNSRWQTTIEPDQSAVLEITYDNAKMPEKGAIERVVYFTTNDPENSAASIEFRARVE